MNMKLYNMMKHTLSITVACAITTLLLSFTSCQKEMNAVSPDGRSVIELGIDQNGEINYSIKRDGKYIILPSAMGYSSMEKNMKDGFHAVKIKQEKSDEQWTQKWGENKNMTDRHNETAVMFSNGEMNLTIRLRAFDDGVAFRYEWDADKCDSLQVTDELTEFRFAGDGESWSIPANFNTYELKTRHEMLSEVDGGNTPFTFHMGNVFGSIHEAALYDMPEMCLFKKDSLRFKAELAPLPNGIKAYVGKRFRTSWRTFQLADEAVGLINSSMILNLNEPSEISDVTWIKPQKYIGIWWGLHLGKNSWVQGEKHGATTENAIRYIDFAARHNIQGVLFEGWNKGWENWGKTQEFNYLEAYDDFDLPTISRYARQNGVELWLHNETGGNIPEYEKVLEEAMKMYSSYGVHTLKTGYAGGIRDNYQHHSQYMVKHYQKVVETAAKYHIMIDAHEPIKDTGIRRTWPNMMTREGARGMEWNAWSEGNSAEYLCTIPFVRLLGGPMDYTPGIFDLDYSTIRGYKIEDMWNEYNTECRIKTTLARQIANWVIIYSPLQMASDLIENYETHPAFQFFVDYEADCDWSKALQGEIGEYIVMARGAGEKIFLGAGTNSKARSIDQVLDFLQEGTTYESKIYCDSLTPEDHPETYRILTREYQKGDTLHIDMASRGGCAVSFIPKKNNI